MGNKLIIMLVLCIALLNCNQSDSVISQSSQLQKVKKVRDITYRVTYQTPQMLAEEHYKELIEGQISLDSLIAYYNQSRTFLIEISSENNPQISTIDVSNLEEFKQRYHELNFEIERIISLELDDRIYYPVMYHFEDVTGKINTSALTVVFAPNSLNDSTFYRVKEFSLRMHDEKLRTGINHFKFQLS